MKTAGGIAFAPIDSRYRVGFLTINPGISGEHRQVSPDRQVRSDPEAEVVRPVLQAGSQRRHAAARGAVAGRPLLRRQARRHQQGHARRSDAVLLPAELHHPDHGRVLERQRRQEDSTPATAWTTRTATSAQHVQGGPPDLGRRHGRTRRIRTAAGRPTAAKGTLADVALYYYQTDLRPAGSNGALGTDVADGQRAQPARPLGNQLEPEDAQQAAHDHLRPGHGRRPDGLARRTTSRPRAGDFSNVRKGALNACSWVSGTCNWPVPGDSQAAPTWTTCGTPR